MKKSELKQIIKEEIIKILKESMSVDKYGNLIGLPNPPSSQKIEDSIEKIKNFVENMIEVYSDELKPDSRGWKILELNVKDISDVIIMHGGDVFELPPSNYDEMVLRITPDDGSIDILLWTPRQSINILNKELIGNTYGKGIISFKYKGKLIGNDFLRDINYEYGKDKKYKI
jgi:hypothetical protein